MSYAIPSLKPIKDQIAGNDGDIASNDTDIAANAQGVSDNAADIASNDTDIAANAQGVSDNAADIASNDTDIAANAQGVSDNAADIAALPEPLGVGQTPQDMTASRSFYGTVYQNTTGRPIWIAANDDSRNNKHFDISPDNSTWLPVGRADNGARSMYYALIPDGWYYRYGDFGFRAPIWMEVR